MKKKIPVSAVLIALAVPALAALPPTDLRCDGQVNPLAASPLPRLSWRLQADGHDQSQSAWQVFVASSPQNLADGKSLLWDSGKQERQRSPFVNYAGKALAAGKVCYWKARYWDSQGNPSGWSEPATWEVAPASPADWAGARWIDDGKANPARDEDFYKPDPAPLMRGEFTLTKPVVSARLHIAGLGYCLPSINGNAIADHVLDPPWTNFDKRILYRTHDVGRHLKEGANCLGLSLGNGWYNTLPLRMWSDRVIRKALPTGRPRVIALLVVEHADGTRTTLTTGRDWKTTEGPTLRNSIYLGEERDARLAIPGWDKPGFDDSAWKPVKVNDAPLGPLQPIGKMPPVRAMEPLPAVAVTTPKPGTHIVDFGQNFTGVPEITLNAPAGTRVLLRFGELLHKDGTLNPMTSVCGQIKGTREGPDGARIPKGGPGAPEIAWQQDVYITRGGGPEVYRPAFTFHAFRYMEVTGLPRPPKAEDCLGVPMHSDLSEAGAFSCSNDLLNAIQQACLRTFHSNVVSVQSDCPHRERFGYGGDIVATSETFLMNFNMAGFYAKTVRDWDDAARPDGRLTDTAPFVSIDYCGVGWAMVHPLLLEQLHQHYGCLPLLKEQVPVAIRWLDGEAERRAKGLVTKGLSDHEALERGSGSAMTTAMFIDAARRVARLSRIIGRDEDADRFESMADRSAAAWSAAFLDARSGQVASGSQSELAFALGFGAAPEEARQPVFNRLVQRLTEPEDGPRLTTGIYGTWILLEQLSKRDRSDLAYGLATRKTFPSWGWMLENDATTLWEHWAGSTNTYSHNHPMFGSISGWFFRWLGGIQAAPDAVGFDRILIRPKIAGDLQWVKSSHRSIRGLIQSDWSVKEDGAHFHIVIPPDTTAVIELPGNAGSSLSMKSSSPGKPKGAKILPVREIMPAKRGGPVEQVIHRIETGSGTYQFTVTPKK